MYIEGGKKKEGKGGLLFYIIINYLWISLQRITGIFKYHRLIYVMLYQELHCFQPLCK